LVRSCTSSANTYYSYAIGYSVFKLAVKGIDLGYAQLKLNVQCIDFVTGLPKLLRIVSNTHRCTTHDGNNYERADTRHEPKPSCISLLFGDTRC